MRERKAALAQEADAFIALPGSYLNNSQTYILKCGMQVHAMC